MTQQKIEVMQAYMAGKKIQHLCKHMDDIWHDTNLTPSWNWELLDYRVKVEITWSWLPHQIVARKEDAYCIIIQDTTQFHVTGTFGIGLQTPDNKKTFASLSEAVKWVEDNLQ